MKKETLELAFKYLSEALDLQCTCYTETLYCKYCAKITTGQNLLNDLFEESNMNQDEILNALDDSVKLQSHYAGLLNQYDGGQRLQFENTTAWLKRLEDMREGKLKK